MVTCAPGLYQYRVWDTQIVGWRQLGVGDLATACAALGFPEAAVAWDVDVAQHVAGLDNDEDRIEGILLFGPLAPDPGGKWPEVRAGYPMRCYGLADRAGWGLKLRYMPPTLARPLGWWERFSGGGCFTEPAIPMDYRRPLPFWLAGDIIQR